MREGRKGRGEGVRQGRVEGESGRKQLGELEEKGRHCLGRLFSLSWLNVYPQCVATLSVLLPSVCCYTCRASV